MVLFSMVTINIRITSIMLCLCTISLYQANLYIYIERTIILKVECVKKKFKQIDLTSLLFVIVIEA
jgi:hypothetical protein